MSKCLYSLIQNIKKISFLIFLILLSYVMMCDFYPIKQLNDDGFEIGREIGLPEKILICWVAVFALDELRIIIVSFTILLFIIISFVKIIQY